MAKKQARKSRASAGAARRAGRRAATQATESRNGRSRRQASDPAQQENPGLRRRGDAQDQIDTQTQAAERQEAFSGDRGSAKQPKRAMTLDEVNKENGRTKLEDVRASGLIDHAALNHPRSEAGGHVVAHQGRARVEAPPPRDITQITDEAEVAEKLRLETKADNLIYWHRQERQREANENGKTRQSVLDAIVARLREVQGDPLPPLD